MVNVTADLPDPVFEMRYITVLSWKAPWLIETTWKLYRVSMSQLMFSASHVLDGVQVCGLVTIITIFAATLLVVLDSIVCGFIVVFVFHVVVPGTVVYVVPTSLSSSFSSSYALPLLSVLSAGLLVGSSSVLSSSSP